MDGQTELSRILQEYNEDIGKLEAGRRPLDGFLGMGRVPSADACHDRMDRAVETLAAAFPPDEAPDELVIGILQAEKTSDVPEYARLSLIAAQRHCLPLIGRMTLVKRQALLEWYLKAYPRRVRLPLQKAVIEALQAR